MKQNDKSQSALAASKEVKLKVGSEVLTLKATSSLFAKNAGYR